MSAQAQTALWAVAVLLPFALNAWVGKRPDAIGLSGMLIIGWGFQRVCWAIWTPPEAMQFYPLMDAAFGLTALSAWITARRFWKLVLACVFATQCALHAAFWLGWENAFLFLVGQPTSASALLRYIQLNNVAFALELCIVAWPGGLDVARSLVSGLPARAWHRHHASP